MTATPPVPEVHLYWLTHARTAGLRADPLSVDEQARLDRFLSPSRRADFLAGRLLLRFALRTWGLPLEALRWQASGRPSLEGAGYDVSLAHAGGHVVVAVARGGRVGVDVEMHHPRERSLMDLFFHAEERAWMGESLERLHQLWTVKEAALKALGAGLSGNPLRVHVSPMDGRVRMRDVADGCLCRWRHDGADHSAAAVLLCPAPLPHPARFLLRDVAPEDLGGDLSSLRNIA